MVNKISNAQIFLPIISILLISFVSFGTSCCEKDRISTLVDTAVDLLKKVKLENIPYDRDSTYGKPLDCADLYRRGFNKSGVYAIWPVSRVTERKRIEVYCDMTDGGWTVIQRRGDFGRADDFFDQDWPSYKKGFGNLKTDFWLGNDNIFAISNQRRYSIRVELEDTQRNRGFAQYDTFWLDDEFNQYTLHASGYRGTAGDSLVRHNNGKFTTKDRTDVTLEHTTCGVKNKNGWWFHECYDSNLNGLYNNVSHGIIWWPFKRNMEFIPKTEMKIKPSNF